MKRKFKPTFVEPKVLVSILVLSLFTIGLSFPNGKDMLAASISSILFYLGYITAMNWSDYKKSRRTFFVIKTMSGRWLAVSDVYRATASGDTKKIAVKRMKELISVIKSQEKTSDRAKRMDYA